VLFQLDYLGYNLCRMIAVHMYHSEVMLSATLHTEWYNHFTHNVHRDGST